MRVAVAGAGCFAKYFAEELPKAGHEVVILTRSHKAFFDGKPGVLGQRITDYTSVAQLVELLHDCDALVATIPGMFPDYIDAHLALIEACKQTPKCKRFIPSEFAHNSEAFPVADIVHPYNQTVKEVLKAQDDLEWTVVMIGWVMDYVVPSSKRHLYDVEGMFPLDMQANTLTIDGSGHDTFSITRVRDVAKAVGELLKTPKKWRHYTSIQGEATTWMEVAEVLKRNDKVTDLEIRFESVDTLKEIVAAEEKGSFMAAMAEFKLYTPKGMLALDQKKVQRDREEFFPDIRFSTIMDLLNAVEKNPAVVV